MGNIVDRFGQIIQDRCETKPEAARKLLKQGAAPAEAALSAGFSDQSHFTNYFSRFIGLSPGAYRDIFWKRGRD